MRRNAQLDITGSLLYVNGLFVHTLEGPRDAVISVYMKIRADPRHRDAVMVYMAPQDERVYSTAFELTTATEEMLSAFPPLQVWGRALCVSLPCPPAQQGHAVTNRMGPKGPILRVSRPSGVPRGARPPLTPPLLWPCVRPARDRRGRGPVASTLTHHPIGGAQMTESKGSLRTGDGSECGRRSGPEKVAFFPVIPGISDQCAVGDHLSPKCGGVPDSPSPLAAPVPRAQNGGGGGGAQQSLRQPPPPHNHLLEQPRERRVCGDREEVVRAAPSLRSGPLRAAAGPGCAGVTAAGGRQHYPQASCQPPPPPPGTRG